MASIKFITDSLSEMAEAYRVNPHEATDRFRAQAYLKAVKSLKALKKEYLSADEVDSLTGVGDKTKTKIKELIATGHLKKLETLQEDPDLKLMKTFTEIHGVGTVKAREWIDKGYKSLKQVKKLEKNNLTKQQILGFKYYKDFRERIPRSEIDLLYKKVKRCLRAINSENDIKLKFEIAGSYRRGVATSGDIDIIITERHDRLPREEIIATLTDQKILIDDLAVGDKKYMGVAKILKDTPARRVDIEWCSYKEYPFCLLYFTGSADFNVKMRGVAKERNMVLNEKGLFQDGVLVKDTKFKKETDIISFLGFEEKYNDPTLR